MEAEGNLGVEKREKRALISTVMKEPIGENQLFQSSKYEENYIKKERKKAYIYEFYFLP